MHYIIYKNCIKRNLYIWIQVYGFQKKGEMKFCKEIKYITIINIYIYIYIREERKKKKLT